MKKSQKNLNHKQLEKMRGKTKQSASPVGQAKPSIAWLMSVVLARFRQRLLLLQRLLTAERHPLRSIPFEVSLCLVTNGPL